MIVILTLELKRNPVQRSRTDNRSPEKADAPMHERCAARFPWPRRTPRRATMRERAMRVKRFVAAA